MKQAFLCIYGILFLSLQGFCKEKDFAYLRKKLPPGVLWHSLLYIPEYESEVLKRISPECLKSASMNEKSQLKPHPLVFCEKYWILECLDSLSKEQLLNDIEKKINTLPLQKRQKTLQRIQDWASMMLFYVKLDNLVYKKHFDQEAAQTAILVGGGRKLSKRYAYERAILLGYKDGKFPDEPSIACLDDIAYQVITEISSWSKKEQEIYWKNAINWLEEYDYKGNKYPRYEPKEW